MNLVIYSRTPLAAAPYELFKALRKYTDLRPTLVNRVDRYSDGRRFPTDALLGGEDGRAVQAIKDADLWHVNNYHDELVWSHHHGQRVLAQFHSIPRLGNWKALWDASDTRYTISQPAQVQEYSLPALPNIIDPDEYLPMRRKGRVRIGFAPTNSAPIGVPGSKGSQVVQRVLDQVAKERDVDVVIIQGMEYRANLELKRTCHILIDDVVNPTWHRTSLEGACFACAVMNASRTYPWVHATVKTLRDRLLWLIDDRAALADIGEQARLWALQEWHPLEKVREYQAAYKATLEAAA